MKWYQSLRARVSVILLSIAFVVIGAGVLVLYEVHELNTASQTIVQDGVPTIRSAQQMLLAVQKANQAITRVSHTSTFNNLHELQAAQADFNAAVLQYELFTAVLLFGSDTQDFLQYNGGLLFNTWSRRGLHNKLKVTPVNPLLRLQIQKSLQSFREYVLASEHFVRSRKTMLRMHHITSISDINATNAALHTIDVLANRIIARMQIIVDQNDSEIQLASTKVELAKRPLLVTTIVSFTITLIMITLCIVALQYFILKPIQLLTSAAQSISNGDIAQHVELRNYGEISILATVFTNMTAKLQAAQSTLEQRVQQQTQELCVKVTEADEQKRAMLNILEDFDESRLKLEMSKEHLLEAKKRIELEAKNAKKFEQAVTAATNAIAILSPDLQIVFVNPAWEQSTGYMLSEVLQTTPMQFIQDDLQVDATQAITTSASRGEVYSSDELVFMHKDGVPYNVEMTVYPVGSISDPEFFVSIHSDITERKKVDSAKSHFVSLASHQLRTPLTAIRWIFDMFNKGKVGKFTAAQQDLINDAMSCTDNMADTVGTMLMLSRLEAGKVALDIQDIAIADVCNTVWHEQKLIADRQQQTCTFAVPQSVRIATDEKMLREIVANLLSNAVKYTPEKGEILVSAHIHDSSCILSVQDSGCGIPKYQQEKVFSKFFRAENVLAQETEGTGLGLYLVASLVTLLHGTILFTSVENEGTTFTVTLPISLHE